MGVRHRRIYGGHVLLRTSPILSKSDEEPTINKFRLIGKYIDMVSLAVFGGDMGVRHRRIYGRLVFLRTFSILSKSDEEPTINKFRLIGKYIDMVSLAVFGGDMGVCHPRVHGGHVLLKTRVESE